MLNIFLVSLRMELLERDRFAYNALSYAALSDLYREGDGVEQNLSKAEEMYLKFIELAN